MPERPRRQPLPPPGTRWEASPFLIALIDTPDAPTSRAPERGEIPGLLTSITVGNHRDDDLPFASAEHFAAAAILDGVATTALVNRFHLEDDDYTDKEITCWTRSRSAGQPTATTTAATSSPRSPAG